MAMWAVTVQGKALSCGYTAIAGFARGVTLRIEEPTARLFKPWLRFAINEREAGSIKI
ncbi:hypothetical protein ACTL6P_08265 [Endozoicomonas acroporae]|uniref:hypothetical protein n=1 Tax=Endozoicomonas acroporae TaxID=1701104 RepID=UPI0015E06B87|nr:hypothetical protein [Endozoicomonas acroporae]